MRNLSIVLATSLLLLSNGVLAQAGSDPKLISTVTPDTDPVNGVLPPDSISLSKNGFVGRVPYKVYIKNGAANTLNNAVFTAETVVVNGAGAIAPFESGIKNGENPSGAIPQSAINPNCKISSIAPNKINCIIGSLASGQDLQFLIFVNTPGIGSQIDLKWSFGGDEGGGNGNGCCTKSDVLSPATYLVDSADTTQKQRVRSYLIKDLLTSVFTGTVNGATATDPWVTFADAGSSYTVPTGTYTTATIEEVLAQSSCSAVNKNRCWTSKLSIPFTTWDPTTPLYVTLERHSSIIKSGTKLVDYAREFVYLSDDPTKPPYNIPFCADLPFPKEPTEDFPCLASKSPNLPACVQRKDPLKASEFVWSCTVKAVNNGLYTRR